jgi:hypothetical protein
MSIYSGSWDGKARDKSEEVSKGCHLCGGSRKRRKKNIQTPSPMPNIRDTQITDKPRDRNLELSKADTC